MLGFIYSFSLYYKDKKSDFKPWIVNLLAMLRLIAISLISFLLLGPLIKTITRSVEKPIIIIARDNSQSILINQDTGTFIKDYNTDREELYNTLSENYDLITYTFGESVKENQEVDFGDKITDISSLFSELEAAFANRNVGALILESDGIYNRGSNPLYSSDRITFPIYTIARGDSTVKRDILIDNVISNSIAYMGNEFPVEIIVRADGCSGDRSFVKITKNGKILFSEQMLIDEDNFLARLQTSLKAEGSGIQHYRVEVSEIENEISVENNSYDFFIDIIDAKQKILILSVAPHPDIGALRSAIELNENYEIDLYMLQDFVEDVSKFDLIILYQLPSRNYLNTELMNEVRNAGIPLLFILGQGSDIPEFNLLQTGLSVFGDNKTFENVYPVFNSYFSLFTINDELKNTINRVTPLNSPFGTYNITATNQVLLFQRIGKLVSDYPLIMFNQDYENKYGIIAGEGIWRWKLSDFKYNGNHESFNEIVQKTMQYLTIKADKSFFRVSSKSAFNENDDIDFNAEVYNENYELINNPEVTIRIIDSEGKEYPFSFIVDGDKYYLNAGRFPVGKYKYMAETNVGDRAYTEHGEFLVKRLNMEAHQTTANHNLLYSLARKHDGGMYFPDEIEDLVSGINSRDDILSVAYYEKRFSSIINLFWLFVVIVGLLGLEWFLRKWHGSY